jgi:lauroyl/myristoyl acyltransferase
MSLEQRLDELEQPKAHLVELTGQTLPIRVYGSALFHRLLPDPLALRLAALRGRLEWFVVPRRRAEALALTRAIRGVASNRFARGRLIEDAVRAELQWRPSLYRRIPVEGLEHFQAARARSGGAVILANVHVGPFLGLVHALAARGVKLYLPGGEWGTTPVRHGLRGEALLMAIDVPGEVDVELAGRPARVRSGIARLALETGSPILPIVTLRRGWRFVGIIGEPIDPAGFDDPATLTRHLVAVQAPVFLQDAEQVHAHAIDVWDDAVARLTRPKVGR